MGHAYSLQVKGVKGSKVLKKQEIKKIEYDFDLLRFHSLFWRSVACSAQALCFLHEECWETIHDTDNCSLEFTWMNQDPHKLHLTPCFGRKVAWNGACLQSTGEEVKGYKLLENKKLSKLTRTWICSVFIPCFEDQWRVAPRLFCSYMKSAGTQYMTQTIAV